MVRFVSLRRIGVALPLLLLLAPTVQAAESTGAPGCPGLAPHACLARAIRAMGGRARLQAIDNVEVAGLGHRQLTEQSYRQAPFLSSYTRFHDWLDFKGHRVRLQRTVTWPQAGGTSPVERKTTVVVTPTGGDHRVGGHEVPVPATERRATDDDLALDPVRLLLTADAADDLSYAAPVRLHGTRHGVLVFTERGRPVRLLLDPETHLPDAVDTTRVFDDFWYAWGDVHQRVYFDNWILVDGVDYPTTRITQRNGIEWRSSQALTVKFNVPLRASAFATRHTRPTTAATGNFWQQPFKASHHVQLAPGIDLYQGNWNTTLIRQRDGVVVLEAPISPAYTHGILRQAHKRYPDLPVKAVLSTSDSWPHVAGVREAVAAGVPIYALDLNLPLLKRFVDAPHILHPDDLQMHPRAPHWRIVSGRRVLGRGANRIEMYPLRGADTGRQYMVYFPARQLLYASDTLSIDARSHALYQPELMHEVMQAVARHHLKVRTVYAMHQGPTPWTEVRHLVAAARRFPAAVGASGVSD